MSEEDESIEEGFMDLEAPALEVLKQFIELIMSNKNADYIVIPIKTEKRGLINLIITTAEESEEEISPYDEEESETVH